MCDANIAACISGIRCFKFNVIDAINIVSISQLTWNYLAKGCHPYFLHCIVMFLNCVTLNVSLSLVIIVDYYIAL
jgi:hypothetical protein